MHDAGGRLRAGLLFLLYRKILQTTSLRDATVAKVRWKRRLFVRSIIWQHSCWLITWLIRFDRFLTCRSSVVRYHSHLGSVMTYNVFGGTLSLTQSITPVHHLLHHHIYHPSLFLSSTPDSKLTFPIHPSHCSLPHFLELTSRILGPFRDLISSSVLFCFLILPSFIFLFILDKAD